MSIRSTLAYTVRLVIVQTALSLARVRVRLTREQAGSVSLREVSHPLCLVHKNVSQITAVY